MVELLDSLSEELLVMTATLTWCFGAYKLAHLDKVFFAFAGTF